MKIIRNDNGKFTIDGEHVTTITPNEGEDWLKIDGINENEIESIKNFIVIYPEKKENE
jgi:hypothetical protein